jgi:hypothetical protein
VPRLGVFKWRKFILGLAKIGQLIQIDMGTREKKRTRHGYLKHPAFFVFRKDSGLEM